MTTSILIIDDEQDIRTYLMAAFEDHGYQTHELDGSDMTPSDVLALKPGVILLDIMMPNRSGLSIYKELRSTADLETVPVILMTGMSLTEDFNEREFNQLLAEKSISPPNGFIEKPIQLPELLSLVDQLISE
jgi:CheY-like chemotaxis protein